MAFYVHQDSKDALGDELNLFEVPPTVSSIESSNYVAHTPISTLFEDNPIEFTISGTNELLDLRRSYLHVKAKIVSPQNQPYTDDKIVAFVNLGLHSMFKQADVFINDHLITESNVLYPYRSYLETALNYSLDSKNSVLNAEGYYEDVAGRFDNIKTLTTDLVKNDGFMDRWALSKKSQTLEFVGKPHLDIFAQSRLMLDNVNIRVRFIRSKNDFVLIGSEPSKLRIEEITIYVRKVKLMPNISLSHENLLSKTTAKYPIKRVNMQYFAIPNGSSGISKDNIVLGTLPQRVLLCLVGQEAFHGKLELNPFNLKHLNVSNCSLYLDGQQIPNTPFKTNFEKGECVRPFYEMFQTLDLTEEGRGNDVTLYEYKNGTTIFAFDLTPTQLTTGGYFNLLKRGNLKLELGFEKALTEAAVAILYLETDDIIEINKDRQVIHE